MRRFVVFQMMGVTIFRWSFRPEPNREGRAFGCFSGGGCHRFYENREGWWFSNGGCHRFPFPFFDGCQHYSHLSISYLGSKVARLTWMWRLYFPYMVVVVR